MMNERKNLIKQLQREIRAVGAGVPRLLAAYAFGDRITGRSLWSTPVDVALIVDIPTTPSRLGNTDYLSDTDLDKIKAVLEKVKCRFHYHQYKLEEKEGGKIGFQQERFRPVMFQYQGALAVVHGVRLYHTTDFLLKEFERDIHDFWNNPEQFQKPAFERFQKHLEAFSLEPIALERYRWTRRFDFIYIGETLVLLSGLLSSVNDLRKISISQFMENLNLRNRVRFTWQRVSTLIGDLARHVVSNQTRETPANYTQLMDCLANMGIVKHDDVPGLTVICEHFLVGVAPQKPGEEDVETFYQLLEHVDCAERFLVGMTRYIHWELTA